MKTLTQDKKGVYSRNTRKDTMKTVMQRITPEDKTRLQALAKKNHRDAVEQLSSMLDWFEIMDKIPSLEFTGRGDEIGKAFKEWTHQ